MYLGVSLRFCRTFKIILPRFNSIQPIIAENSARSIGSNCLHSRVSNTNRVSDGVLTKDPSMVLTPSKLHIIIVNSNYSGGTAKCWKCGYDQGSAVFCKYCKVIQRPDTKISYFNILEIEQNYAVELSNLTSNYRKLQNVLHPDRFTNRHEEEKRLSEEYSSLVNKAYFTLLSPLKRGLYMLEQSGVFVEEGTIQSSPEFLMEIMERNEDVDAAKSSDQLETLNKQNKASFDKLIRELTDAFKKEDLKLAEEAVTKMKYYASIDLKIKKLKQKDL